MSRHTHSPDIMKQICDQMGADLDTPACRAVKEHLKNCPDCEAYFNTVRKTVMWCREMERGKNISPALRKRLFKKLHLDK